MNTKREIFYKALIIKDNAFEGIFIVGVKTTGIFCRPTCPARPKMENVEFYPTMDDALANGYRACKVCKPQEPYNKDLSGTNRLLNYMEGNPALEIKSADIEKMGLDPKQVNKWAMENYGLTFSDFQRIYGSGNVFHQSK